MFRCFAPTIGFVAALELAVLAVVTAPAYAQTNIDQGKSPAEIYASDCAVCHKSPRGLSDGKTSSTLSSFLTQHYTASPAEAAALAAYVLAGGSGPGQAAEPKVAEPKVGEPKTGEPKTGEAKTGEAKTGEARNAESKKPDAKTASRPTHPSAKPEDAAPPTGKLQRPDGTPNPVEVAPTATPQRSTASKHVPVTASRNHKQEPETASPQEPAPVVAVPVVAPPIAAAPAANATENPVEAPSQESDTTTTAAAPAAAQPSESSPVPRDNIPD